MDIDTGWEKKMNEEEVHVSSEYANAVYETAMESGMSATCFYAAMLSTIVYLCDNQIDRQIAYDEVIKELIRERDKK